MEDATDADAQKERERGKRKERDDGRSLEGRTHEHTPEEDRLGQERGWARKEGLRHW